MKIAVIGIGSIGSYYASKLSETNELIGIDSNEVKVNKINAEGLFLIEDNEEKKYNFKAVLPGKCNEIQDLVIVFVKSTQTVQALKESTDIIGPNTIVLTLQNGLGNLKDISMFVKKENIVLGNTKINCVSKDINHVKCSGFGVTNVGSLGSDKKKELVIKLVLNKAKFECEVNDNIKDMIWRKLLINAAVNPLCALFNCKIKVIYENKYIWEIAEHIVEEACEIAKFENVNLKYEDIIEDIRKLVYSSGSGYASMYQDVKNKKFTEIDRINGAIVNIGYKNKYEAPFNSFVVNAIKGLEKLY